MNSWISQEEFRSPKIYELKKSSKDRWIPQKSGFPKNPDSQKIWILKSKKTLWILQLPKTRLVRVDLQVTSKAEQLQEQAAEAMSSAKEKDQMLGSDHWGPWALPLAAGEGR